MRAIAFASTHAVDAVWGALTALGRDARALFGVRLATVGEATARRLALARARAPTWWRAARAARRSRPRSSTAKFEGPILVPRARGRARRAGRRARRRRLHRRGRRRVRELCPTTAALARAVAAHRARAFDAIAFTSPRGARAFLDAAGGPASVGGALVGAIGPTTRRALAELGVAAEVMPEQADIGALLDVLRVALASSRLR